MVLDHTIDKHTRICLDARIQAKSWMIRYGCQTMLPRFPFIKRFPFNQEGTHRSG